MPCLHRISRMLLKEFMWLGGSFRWGRNGQAHIRVQLSAAHEQERLDKAIKGVVKLGKELGVLESVGSRDRRGLVGFWVKLGDCWGSWIRLKSLQFERPRGPSLATSSPAFQPSKISNRCIPIPQGLAIKLAPPQSYRPSQPLVESYSPIKHGFTDQSNAKYLYAYAIPSEKDRQRLLFSRRNLGEKTGRSVN